MTKASDLKNLFNAGEPLVEQWLDLAEQFAALRDAATEKEIDWSQVKALLKAKAQDERDGGYRLEKLLDRADNAASYADTLGIGKNNFSSEPEPKPAPPPVAPQKPAEAISSSVALDDDIPKCLDRRLPAGQGA